MTCLLVKKTKKVDSKTYANYYLHFDNGVIVPVAVKEYPLPKAENYGKKEDYQKELEFRKATNLKLRTQFDTLATLVKEEDK